VREVHEPFSRFDDKGADAGRNGVFAWQSGHRPLQRGSAYGLDGAFPTTLQPQLFQFHRGFRTVARVSSSASTVGPTPPPLMIQPSDKRMI
jgi:hypothetical protein